MLHKLNAKERAKVAKVRRELKRKFPGSIVRNENRQGETWQGHGDGLLTLVAYLDGVPKETVGIPF